MKHPELCRKCAREYHTPKEGPDKGVPFICGIMAEGHGGCSGTYYLPKQCAPIIDAEGDKQ